MRDERTMIVLFNCNNIVDRGRGDFFLPIFKFNNGKNNGYRYKRITWNRNSENFKLNFLENKILFLCEINLILKIRLVDQFAFLLLYETEKSAFEIKERFLKCCILK